jgi:amino acid adenylation domain-containing protein
MAEQPWASGADSFARHVPSITYRQLKQIDLPLHSAADTMNLATNEPNLAGSTSNTVPVQAKPHLSETKRALMQAYVSGMMSNRSAITPRSGNGPWPLSFAQERLWFLDQLSPGTPVYNVPVAIRMEGRLDVAALKRALSTLVERHEALRTLFVTVDGVPSQTISPARPVELPLEDLSALPEEEQRQQLEKKVNSWARRCFDLAADPLLSPYLIRCGDQDHTLVLNLHHICADGPSMRSLHQELATMYHAFTQGEEPSLPPLSMQYADYAQWQRNSCSPEVVSKQLAYWRQQLHGAPPYLDMPADFSRPAEQTNEGARNLFQLPESLVDKLRRFSAQSGVSLFMTTLAGFEVLLHRYTGQEDIVVGTPLANRPRPELEGVIGFFLNAVALRLDVSGDPSFSELVKRVRKVALEGFSNADLPFEQLLEEIKPDRAFSRTSVFQVMFTLQLAPTPSFRLRELKITSREVNTGTSKFDLFVVMQENAPQLGGYVEYDTNLFQAATIERMISHFTRLLEAAMLNPEQSISRLPLLSEAERRQLVIGWNDTHAAYPSDQCIHELFEKQAERSPQQIALRCQGLQLPYAELNRRANQLARKLKDLGVGVEVPVGIFLDRSLDMMVAVLGVLKAGGAYVPMDPAYPKQWSAFLLEDSRAPVLLTREKMLAALPTYSGAVVCMDRDWAEVAHYEAANLEKRSNAESLAYIIYTSGSTGTPKGVMGLHRGAVNRFAWMWGKYPFGADEVCCQKTSLNFVDSVWEIFGPLLRGVSSVVLSDTVVKDALALARELDREHVSRIVLVPSLMRVLLEAYVSLPRSTGRPRLWISSGEALPPELCVRFHELVPQGVLLNLYGSSEVAGDVTYYEPDAGSAVPPSVPLGLPIANTQVHILDRQLQVLPVGVPGEIYVGGNALARGYYGRPELTAECFVPSPFPEFAGNLYKSGDIGVRDCDGQIKYLGRIDQQVKIRGFRVELGHIESCLAKHPGVQDAVVVSRPDGSGEDIFLVAYIVPAREADLAEHDLRTFLRYNLPQHMIPSRFVVLDSLPLTPNGKVDRCSLPQPQETAHVEKTINQAAGNEIEARLVEIWQEILNRQKIGVNDNFFDLGGHSLLLTRLILRIDQAFGRRVSLGDVFHAPTIASLARMLGQDALSSPQPGIVPIQANGDRLPLFWIYGGPLFRCLAQQLGSNQPFLGVYIPPAVLETLSQPYKFEDLASAFVQVLRQRQPHGPYHLCGLCVNGALAYEISRQLQQQGEHVGLLAMFDSQNPALYFKYAEGRLRYLWQWAKYHLAKISEATETSLWCYLQERCEGISRHMQFMKWRFLRNAKSSHRFETPEGFGPIVHPASFGYRPQPYGGRVVLFQCMDFPEGQYWDFEAGWRPLARGGVETHRLPRNHLAMFKEPNLVSVVAGKLATYLAESAAHREQAPRKDPQITVTVKTEEPKSILGNGSGLSCAHELNLQR